MGRAERPGRYPFRTRLTLAVSGAVAAGAIGAGGVAGAELIQTQQQVDAAIADIRAQEQLPLCEPPGIEPTVPTTVQPEPNVPLFRTPVQAPVEEPCITPEARAQLLPRKIAIYDSAIRAYGNQALALGISAAAFVATAAAIGLEARRLRRRS